MGEGTPKWNGKIGKPIFPFLFAFFTSKWGCTGKGSNRIYVDEGVWGQEGGYCRYKREVEG